MQLDRHDMAVIEQALREAIHQGADYYKIATYQSVLGKMKEIAPFPSLRQADSAGGSGEAGGGEAGGGADVWK